VRRETQSETRTSSSFSSFSIERLKRCVFGPPLQGVEDPYSLLKEIYLRYGSLGSALQKRKDENIQILPIVN
jgi:hypothetical protein